MIGCESYIAVTLVVPLLVLSRPSMPAALYRATTRQSCSWSSRLQQSPTAHSFRTCIINFQKHAKDTSFLTFLLHWLTFSQSMNSEHCTAPVRWLLLHLVTSRFVIIIIIIIIIYYFLTSEKPRVVQKLEKEISKMFVCAHPITLLDAQLHLFDEDMNVVVIENGANLWAFSLVFWDINLPLWVLPYGLVIQPQSTPWV